MLTLATIPDFYPRSKNAGKAGPDGKVNVADPDRLVMGPDEYKKFAEGAEYKTAKFAVRKSDHGAGVLEVTKVTYSNGQYKIIPEFKPNNKQGPWVSCQSMEHGWPFIDGKAAMKAMAVTHNITFKEAKFND